MAAVTSETACVSAWSPTRSNSVGMPRPITASVSIDAFIPATRRSNVCRPFRSPPSRNERPSTSSVLPRIDPVIDALATSISPARIAKIVMISSAALPNVALSTPPIFGPALSPSCSVATPTIHASATSASAETRNTRVFAAPSEAHGARGSAEAAAAPATASCSERFRPRVATRGTLPMASDGHGDGDDRRRACSSTGR